MTVRRALLVLLAACGCGSGPSIPGVLLGESAHFRLFFDPDLDAASLPPTMLSEKGLTALETDWADKQALLKMPEGEKIDYHLLTAEHVASVCGFGHVGLQGVTEGGCETGDALQIAAGYLPHQHELMHAYLFTLAPGRVPVPLLVEGGASAIGCNTDEAASLTYSVPWEQVVTESAKDSYDVYEEGGLLARYLIRTEGVDAFIRYYRQAPERRDPGLFAANFWQFWGMTIDEVWSAMHTAPALDLGFDTTICPCTLAPLSTGAGPADHDPDTHPYARLDPAGGETLALARPDGGTLPTLLDCQGVGAEIVLGSADAGTAVVQIPADGRTRYVSAPLGAASAGAYTADTCAATVPTPLPASFLRGGEATVQLSLAPPADLTIATTIYLQFQLPSAARVGVLSAAAELCGSCALDQGACQPLAPPDGGVLPDLSPVAAGPLYVRLTVGPWDAISYPHLNLPLQIFFKP